MSDMRLGLRENAAQFSLLVLVNGFVGAMVGMERSILPLIAEDEFGLMARSAVLSFIVVFGFTKAGANYFAGHLSDRFGRKHVLIAGWLAAMPVPFLLMWAPHWNWVLFANALLGLSQGLSWSATVIMKIDLVGAKRRGLAMGLNEFAGYIAVAGAALATGFVASQYGLRPQPFYLGVVFITAGFLLSVLVVRETKPFAAQESLVDHQIALSAAPSAGEVFRQTSWRDGNLASLSQVGFVNNLNDGVAWGLFPLFFAAAGMTLPQISVLAAVYPATWGIVQLGTGALSDRIGRKRLIVGGMWVQSLGIGIVIISAVFADFALGLVLLGVGTAMVYPTLLSAVGDIVPPSWRASAVGVYRLWRDLGYAFGAIIAGLIADALGLSTAMWVVALLTFVSGAGAALKMVETLPSTKNVSDESSKSAWPPPVR